MIVLDHYNITRMSIPNNIKEDMDIFKGDTSPSLEECINKYLKHSSNADEKLHNVDIQNHLSKYGINETSKILSMLKLMKIGVFQKTAFFINGQKARGFTNITLVNPVE